MKKSLLALSLVVLALTASGCTSTTGELTPEEKNLFVGVNLLAPFGLEDKDVSEYESFYKETWFDGEEELNYEFEYNGTDDGLVQFFYLFNMITLSPSKSTARESHTMTRVGYKMGAVIEDLEFVEKEDFYSYGDSSTFESIIDEETGVPIGNLFRFRKGKVNYDYMISGYHFDNPQEWMTYIEPQLKILEEFLEDK